MKITSNLALVSKARERFHKALLTKVLTINENGVPSNADKGSKASCTIAASMAHKIGQTLEQARLAGQMSGNEFEELVAQFLTDTFLNLTHLRPGTWTVKKIKGINRNEIANYEQFSHLVALQEAAARDKQLAAALGNDYTITPDVVVQRTPEPDSAINAPGHIVDEVFARHTSIRAINNSLPILHASISCKWTLRSDRAQNARTEALNLIRNTKGRLPHIMVVTGEPMPGRIASLALGTGDIDCVYHFALNELQEAVVETGSEDSLDLLRTMIDGKRLKDISDLPLDLAV